MLISPKALSTEKLEKSVLKEDKKNCMAFGPCGVGNKALYLNRLYLKRACYVPFSSVKRVFKRVAGSMGQGVFASVVYLVVVYDDGKERQCLFKRENELDDMLAYIGKTHPEISLLCEKGEEKLAKRAAEEKRKVLPEISREAQVQIRRLEQAREHLEKRSDLTEALTRTAKAKRTNELSNTNYRWGALAVVLAGAALSFYGIYAFVAKLNFASYFLIFGVAIILLFGRILPTKRSSKAYIDEQWEKACEAMEKHIKGYLGFPVPARYAHPVTLTRMIRVIREGRANDVQEALEIVKDDLKKLNADVQIEQEEFDEVMAIKPMFLVENYR